MATYEMKGQSWAVYPGYRSKPTKILGILQLTWGISILVGQIILLGILAVAFEGFSGIWAPPFIIMAGAFGLKSSFSKSKCTVITTLVMSILACVVSIGVILQGALGANAQDLDDDNTADFQCIPATHVCMKIGLGVHIIMAAIGIIEFVTAIVASGFCCHGICCSSHDGIPDHNEEL